MYAEHDANKGVDSRSCNDNVGAQTSPPPRDSLYFQTVGY